ncbi:MAG: CRISPR-associated protein Cas6 [Sulfuricurvum sp.]|jgi:CRISPR-associated endoribonuclease Cas6|uniref:CRISPR-associated endoribonuclease Cas6 n=1 Tax=Sulfuricurvum sp. TaxID=2025608 RepID=UPI0025EB3276|nr:CRISPR-associated endoribonuclease Cas6 [Sulfuricurvum sp.]MCK9372757.1 CRISPR-associated protein Cas6 [Sulfuricurvum sp.]
MHYFELTCVAYLKSDLDFHRSFETLSAFITFSMMRGGLEETHTKSGYKHYVFGGLLPTQSDKTYKKGSTYRFAIRALDEAFITLLSKALRQNIDHPDLIVVETAHKKTTPFFIQELYSATPVIVTCEGSLYWTMEKNGDIVQLQRQLHDNLEKKYQSFYGEAIKAPQNFIQMIEIKNRVPQNIKIHKDGKPVTFFGNKFRIVPNEDPISQKLAFIALACGLGEKNSYGGGFCLAGGMR